MIDIREVNKISWNIQFSGCCCCSIVLVWSCLSGYQPTVKFSGAILGTMLVVLTDVSTAYSFPSNEFCSSSLKLINIGYHVIVSVTSIILNW